MSHELHHEPLTTKYRALGISQKKAKAEAASFIDFLEMPLGTRRFGLGIFGLVLTIGQNQKNILLCRTDLLKNFAPEYYQSVGTNLLGKPCVVDGSMRIRPRAKGQRQTMTLKSERS